MRLLVTRPREEAERLAARLAASGHEVLAEPLLSVRPLPAPDLGLDGLQAVLLTSRNGLRCLAAATPRRDLRILAVGDATAAAAREAGFTEVQSAAGDVTALAALARKLLRPEAGALLHVSGKAAAGDLQGMLKAAGFTVRRVVLYDAVPASALSETAASALRQGRLDGVLFFSPRTAAAFVRLAEAAALAGTAERLVALCLSPAVAEAVAVLAWRRLAVAERPEEAALLRLIEEQDPERGERVE